MKFDPKKLIKLKKLNLNFNLKELMRGKYIINKEYLRNLKDI
jgi:hypothetical protein